MRQLYGFRLYSCSIDGQAVPSVCSCDRTPAVPRPPSTRLPGTHCLRASAVILLASLRLNFSSFEVTGWSSTPPAFPSSRFLRPQFPHRWRVIIPKPILTCVDQREIWRALDAFERERERKETAKKKLPHPRGNVRIALFSADAVARTGVTTRMTSRVFADRRECADVARMGVLVSHERFVLELGERVSIRISSSRSLFVPGPLVFRYFSYCFLYNAPRIQAIRMDLQSRVLFGRDTPRGIRCVPKIEEENAYRVCSALFLSVSVF